MINMLVGLRDWVDARLPIVRAWDTHMGKYYAPKNFNFWYYFGFLSLIVLVNQLLTGIWLTMSYNPSQEGAFASVEYIMRDVDYGWILRYMHSTGASAFFVVVYLHMFRALLYGSYKKPRELIWIFGMLIFVVLMAEAFVGYVLPWGQMSYWGAQVIISLFGAIPVVGEDIVTYAMGGPMFSTGVEPMEPVKLGGNLTSYQCGNLAATAALAALIMAERSGESVHIDLSMFEAQAGSVEPGSCRWWARPVSARAGWRGSWRSTWTVSSSRSGGTAGDHRPMARA